MGNPLSRFLDLIRNPSYSRTTTLLVILTIALSIPLTVFVAQKQQEIRQQAAEPTQCEQNGGYCDNGVCAKFVSKCLYDATLPSNCINPGATCTPTVGDTSKSAHIYQCSELQPSFSCTPTPTQTPATPAPTVAPTSTPSVGGLSCPGSGIPGTPHAGNTEEWGGSCLGEVLNQDRAIAIPGTCNCTVAVCKQFSGGPICWVNNGQTYNNPAGCRAKGANIPSSCFTTSPSPTASPAPSVDGPAPVCKRPADKGAITTCDPSKDTGKNGTKNNPQRCPKLCPDGKTIVSGISVMECQTDFCWYDSLYDTNKGNQQQRTDQFCYYGPTNDPKEAGCPTATAAPTAQGIPCNVGVTCPAGCYGATTGVGTNQVCKINNTNDLCTSGGPVCPTAPTQGVSCSAELVRCPNNCRAQTLPSGNWQCYTNATVFTANKVACEPTTCASAPGATPPPGPSTQLAFTIGLDGLGTVGDSKNPNVSRVNTPTKRTSRTFFVKVIDSELNQQASVQGTISYDSGLGKYKGTVNLGKVVPNGTYIIKVRAQGYKTRVIRNVIITGQSTDVQQQVNLPTGDINSNDEINLVDYEILRGCLFKDASGSCEAADLDDNGKVDEIDYNLFLRDFAAAQREE